MRNADAKLSDPDNSSGWKSPSDVLTKWREHPEEFTREKIEKVLAGDSEQKYILNLYDSKKLRNGNSNIFIIFTKRSPLAYPETSEAPKPK
jgi:hypothetical protein